MDIENVKSWASQPDVCRCCLSTSGTWDLTASYKTDTIKEVYFEMMKDCYGITLSYLTEWGPSRMVCKLCVGHLREACSFRQQVLQAEKHFADYWTARDTVSSVTVKTEEPLVVHSPLPEGCGSGRTHSDDEENHINDNTCLAMIKSEKENKRRKKQKVNRARRKKKMETGDDYDSDAPIAAMIEKNEPSTDGNKEEGLKLELNETTLPIKPTNLNKSKKIQQTRQPSQSIIDNRTLRSNITLVLKNTTIVPFRHINNSKFACLYCDEGFLQFQKLKSHMETHKNITEDQINSNLKTPRDLVKADLSDIACKLCCDNFMTLEHAIEHLVANHKKVYHCNLRMKPAHGILGFNLSSDELKCNVCSKEFRFFKNLSVHMNEHSTSSMCHVCGKKFISEHRLQTHIMMHNRTHIFCKHCFKDFKTVAARNYHIRKEHNDTPYKCPECTESFTQYHHRLKHLVERHKLKMPEFKCEICGKKFASSGGLAAHKRYTHVKAVQYPCEVCGKVFAYKWIWQRHIDVHTGVKKYPCRFCSKKFAKPYTQQMHERIHLDDKRHVCDLCDAAFVQKCSLKNHAKVHHPAVSGESFDKEKPTT